MLNEKDLSNKKLDTLLVQGGFSTDPTTGAKSLPLYQTSAYDLQTAEHAANLFNLEAQGYIYTRLSNPTITAFEKRMAHLENGVSAVAFSSGHAAIFGSITNIATVGDDIVSSSVIYGGTYNMFINSLPKFGIKVKFAADATAENFEKAIGPNTKALYAEVLGNPKIDVLDIEAVAAIAHKHGIPLIIDATLSPYINQSINYGADIVIYSTTKFIDGHGQALGGCVIDAGKFDYNNSKFPSLSEPEPAYHNLRFVDLGPDAFARRLRSQSMRDLGFCMSPFTAFLGMRGLETLHLRMQRHSENALAVATYLEKHPDVSWVSYPALPSHPEHNLYKKYFEHGAGGLLTFDIKGGTKAGRKFINNVKIFNLVANLGDTKSLVIHPASTTHSQLNKEQLESAGVSEDMVRLSVGIEHIDDIIKDLEQAIEKSQK